jgi:alkylhydroperoxidase/carboxymuconolactone decarboxylase family protein YurZ
VSHPRRRLPRNRPPCRPAIEHALDNGLSKDELVHAITHLAFYAGWPCAMSAMSQLKQITEG